MASHISCHVQVTAAMMAVLSPPPQASLGGPLLLS